MSMVKKKRKNLIIFSNMQPKKLIETYKKQKERFKYQIH